jgi:hypothetical protein
MRKLLFLIAIIFLATNIIASNTVYLNSNNQTKNEVVLVSSDDSQTTLSVRVNSYSLVPVQIGSEIYMVVQSANDSRLLEKGSPDLPKFTESLIIPDFGSMETEVISSSYIDIPNIMIAPSKGNFTRDIDPSSVAYEFGKTYQEDKFFPAQISSLSKPYILRDFRGQTVVFTPFQYNPVSKTLRIYTEFEIKIQHSAKAGINTFKRSKLANKMDRQYHNIYTRHFLNYKTTKYTAVPEDGEILVICHPDFIEVMEPYVSWKIQKGIKTTMVDYSTIGTSNAIETYVQTFYNANNLTYLLLVGDHAFVPANSTSAGDSDNAYGYLSGNDSYPEIFVGRFSGETVPHIQTQVERVLDYELNPDMTNFYAHSTAIGSNQGPGDDNEMDYEHLRNMQTDLNAFTYTAAAEFFDGSQGGLDASGNPSSSGVATTVNAGTGMIVYTGHGSNTAFSSSGFNNSNVNNLSNTGKLPFIWSVACVNGNFVPTTCFAEAWMRAEYSNQPAGAIAALMATINQSWNPPMCAQDEMVDILTESYSNNILRSFGAISMNGCMQMNDEYGSGGDQMTDTWTCFGDPAIMVRTAQPQLLTASHDPTAFLGSSQFVVTCPVDDAIAAITLGNEIYGVATVQNGTVTIPHQVLTTTATLTLTLTAFNHAPYVAFIDVVPNTGPYVSVQSFTVNDTNGNQNNQADYNESIALDLVITNIGIAMATNVVGVLSTTDPFVTITDNTHNYGNIDSSSNVTITGIYGIDIADDVEDQHTAPFELVLTDDSANTWTAYINLTLNAPDLDISFIEIDDSQGNGNGRFDPGETVDVKVSVNNLGHAATVGGSCEISSLTTFLNISNTSLVTGNLLVGSPQQLVFTVSVNATTPIGALVPLEFTVESGAYSAITHHQSEVGLIVEDWESNSFNSFEWENDLTFPWIILSNGAFEGSMMAQSANIGSNQSSTLQITIDVLTADSISFYKKVSCEVAGGVMYDYLEFFIDNMSMGQWAGEIDWSKENFPIAAGSRTLKWVYLKDGYVSSGDDCAWIDFIEFPPLDINYAPLFINITDTLTIEYSDPVDILVEAFDMNTGDVLDLNASSLPAFLSFTDNGNWTGSINGTATHADQGYYDISLAVTDNLSDTTHKSFVLFITHPASIVEMNSPGMSIYPNPASDFIIISLNSIESKIINIFNVEGKIIDQIHQETGDQRIEYSTIHLSKGVYYIQSYDKDVSITQKLIILK